MGVSGGSSERDGSGGSGVRGSDVEGDEDKADEAGDIGRYGNLFAS